MAEINKAADEYSSPPELSLSESLILENELNSIHGLLVKIWTVVGQQQDKVSRTHSRTAIFIEAVELAKMADYAAAALRRVAGPEAFKAASAAAEPEFGPVYYNSNDFMISDDGRCIVNRVTSVISTWLNGRTAVPYVRNFVNQKPEEK